MDAEARFGEEQLILVDERGAPVGTESTRRCHEGEGLLHQAISVYLFDDEGRLLIQRRSEYKPLWPGFWSNSCCSHPRAGEPLDDAAHRRVREELGFEAALSRVFTFQYAAAFPPVGWEREVCSVYIGRARRVREVDPREVATGASRKHPSSTGFSTTRPVPTRPGSGSPGRRFATSTGTRSWRCRQRARDPGSGSRARRGLCSSSCSWWTGGLRSSSWSSTHCPVRGWTSPGS